jgi:hypothetical protein
VVFTKHDGVHGTRLSLEGGDCGNVPTAAFHLQQTKSYLVELDEQGNYSQAASQSQT